MIVASEFSLDIVEIDIRSSRAEVRSALWGLALLLLRLLLDEVFVV